MKNIIKLFLLLSLLTFIICGECKKDKFGGNDDKLSGVEGKKVEIEDKKDEMEHKKDEMEHKKDEMEHKKDEMEHKKDEMEHKKDEIEGERDEIEDKKDEIEDKRDEVEDKKDEIEKKNVEHKIDENVHKKAANENKKPVEDKKVGGHSEIDVNDANVENLLKEHLPRINAGESEHLKLLKKIKITQQVVAGMAYHITAIFKIGETDSECVVVIWTRPWLNDVNEKVKIKVECGETVYRTKEETSEW